MSIDRGCSCTKEFGIELAVNKSTWKTCGYEMSGKVICYGIVQFVDMRCDGLHLYPYPCSDRGSLFDIEEVRIVFECPGGRCQGV